MAIPTPLKRVKDFEDLGFGMFVHWGLYSQRGAGEWTYWLHDRNMEEYKLLKDTFTAEDFCADNPRGVYVLGFGNHVATVIDGVIYDSWNSSQEIPQYYFYRKE